MTETAYSLLCPECAAPMELRSSRFGPFYGCTRYPGCDGTHGAHADGTPLGIPADRRTRLARMRAHQIFDDATWKNGRMGRNAAYRLLQEIMGMSREEAHIGRFTVEQCERLIVAIKERQR